MSESDTFNDIQKSKCSVIHLKHIQRWALETFFCERCTFPKRFFPRSLFISTFGTEPPQQFYFCSVYIKVQLVSDNSTAIFVLKSNT